MNPRILVVEDDASVRAVLDRGLRLAGYEPAFAVGVGDARLRWAEAGWILEDNQPMINGLVRMGFQAYKTYRLYDRPL